MNAPIRTEDAIGEFCLALCHRWKPNKCFVIFTSYFDEADTHGSAPTVIMAAHLGHAYPWRQFEKKLTRLQDRHGFKIFHTKDFKAKAGDFSGWSDDRCSQLVYDITELIRDNLTEGITVILERDRYLNEYRAPPIPHKMSLAASMACAFALVLATYTSG